MQKREPGAMGGALFGPAKVSSSRFYKNRAHSAASALVGRAEGGAVYGASRVVRCDFIANEVAGVGPVPDVGPAAEAALLACCTFDDNLPGTLPPLGPRCVLGDCPGLDAGASARTAGAGPRSAAK